MSTLRPSNTLVVKALVRYGAKQHEQQKSADSTHPSAAMAKASKLAQYGGELQFEQWFLLKMTENGFGVILERVSNRKLDSIHAVKQLWFHYQPIGPQVIQPLADYLRMIASTMGFEQAQSFLSYLTRQVSSYFMGVTPYEPVPDPAWSVKIEEIIEALIDIELQEQQFVSRLPYGAIESMIPNEEIIVPEDSKPESLDHSLKKEAIDYQFEKVQIDTPTAKAVEVPGPKMGRDEGKDLSPTVPNKSLGTSNFEHFCSNELSSPKWGGEIPEENKVLFLKVVEEICSNDKLAGHEILKYQYNFSQSLIGRLTGGKPPDITNTKNWLFVRTTSALWGLEDLPENFQEHSFSKIKEKYKTKGEVPSVEAALKEGAVTFGFRKKKPKIKTKPKSKVFFFGIKLDPKYKTPIFTESVEEGPGSLPFLRPPRERPKPQRRTIAEWKSRQRNAAADARQASYSQSGLTRTQIRAARTSRALQKTPYLEEFYDDPRFIEDHDTSDYYEPGNTPSPNLGDGQ